METHGTPGAPIVVRKKRTMTQNITSSALNALITEKYSFDPGKLEWRLGKMCIEEWEVRAFVIKWCRENTSIREKGVFAEKILIQAKLLPEFTYQTFIKTCTGRDRNRRIAGKYLFESWCKSVGIAIEGPLEYFMRKENRLVGKFYDLMSAGLNQVRKRARILGKLFSSVFIGWTLRDENDECCGTLQSPHLLISAAPRVPYSGINGSKNSTRVQHRRRWRGD